METFVWVNGDNFTPTDPVFDREEAGVTDDFPCDESSREADYFSAFIEGAIMDLLVEQTNLFYHQNKDNDPALASPKMRSWTDVTAVDFYVFFALMLLMPHVKKHLLKDYWLVDDIISTPIFGKYMARDRFINILRFLHLVDNESGPTNDRVWKIRDCFNLFRQKFSDYFHPFQKICIDESLVLFRGRVVFRQYIRTKRHRFGLKLFMLADCETGYILDTIIYSGMPEDADKNDVHGLAGNVVKKLVDRYYGRNHILYTDNFYTAPALAKFLLSQKTHMVGTVKRKRKNYPHYHGRLAKGVVEKKMDTDQSMLAFRWMDNREVLFLSTVHEGRMVDTGKKDRHQQTIQKPDAIIDYNVNMRMIDKKDMMVGGVECLRKSVKWYKKLFFHLIDVTMLNAYHLWCVKTGLRPKLRLFSKAVINQLLEKYGQVQPEKGHRSVENLPDRLQCRDYLSRHYLEAVPPPEGARRPRGQKRCYVCATTERREKVRKDVGQQCKECGVGFCLECFKDFHTLKKF